MEATPKLNFDMIAKYVLSDQRMDESGISNAFRWNLVSEVIIGAEVIDEDEGFSIYNDFDFDDVYRNETDDELIWAYSTLAALRAVCYRVAAFNSVGVKERNLTKESEAVMWSRKLSDKLTALAHDRKPVHGWIH